MRRVLMIVTCWMFWVTGVNAEDVERPNSVNTNWIVATNKIDFGEGFWGAMLSTMSNSHTTVTNAYIRDVKQTSTQHLEWIRRDGCVTSVVLSLIENGDVCAVIGHRWELGCGKPGCLVLHLEPIRHCVICGKTQMKKMEDWK